MARYQQIHDHPEIARTLRTGHPRPYKTIQCTDCGSDMSGVHLIYIDNGDVLCGSCLKARILNNYTIDDLADALGVRRITAGDYIEELEEYPNDGD